MRELRQNTALVTAASMGVGAWMGIGAAIARVLADQGVIVS